MNTLTPQCPRCEAIELRRQARAGFLQREVLSRLGYFPWECGQCRQVYLLKLRSNGYRQSIPTTVRARVIDRLLLKDHS